MLGNVRPPELIPRDKPEDKAATVKPKPEEDKPDSVSFRDIFFQKYTERK